MKFFKPIPLYLRLYKNRAKITRLDNGITIDRVSAKEFSNNRLVLGDFLKAEDFLKKIIIELVPKKIFAPSISVLIHQMELTEGGLSEVEKRALRDSILHCNASKVFIIEDTHELNNQEAINKMNTNKV